MTAPDPRPLVAFAHVGHDWITGAEQCVLDLLAGVDRGRYRLLLVCNAPSLAGAARALGVEAVRIPRWVGPPLVAARARRAARAVLRERRAALVHANMPNALHVAGPAARRLGIPVVAHLHLPFASLKPRRQRQVRAAGAVVGCAEHVIAPLRDAPGGARRPPRVIYNAVAADRLAGGDAAGLRAALGIPPSALVATALGSLIPRKGHDVTLAAVARAAAGGADVHALVCGDGESGAALRAEAERLGVAGRVHWLGRRADVGAVLRDATDVLVSSAREEALPLNVLEAAWLGVPVVASDIPGHREAVEPGRTGVLVPPDDPAALAAALAHLARAPGERRALGEAGRLAARARFAMDRYVREFEALYDELLAPGAPPPRGAGAWARALWGGLRGRAPGRAAPRPAAPSPPAAP